MMSRAVAGGAHLRLPTWPLPLSLRAGHRCCCQATREAKSGVKLSHQKGPVFPGLPAFSWSHYYFTLLSEGPAEKLERRSCEELDDLSTSSHLTSSFWQGGTSVSSVSESYPLVPHSPRETCIDLPL